MGKVTFIEELVDIGYVEMGSTDNIVEFVFEGDPRDIEKIRPLCGCTADDLILGNRIQLRYREEITKGKSIEDLKNMYGEEAEFSKYLEIYMKDGKDLFIIKEGVKDYNPEKEFVSIGFKGKIKIR